MDDGIPMAAEDGLWLRLDRATNVLGIVSVLWTATPVEPAALGRVLAERVVAPHPVFRCRPVLDGGWWPTGWWEEDPDFDLDRHLRVESLPRAARTRPCRSGSGACAAPRSTCPGRPGRSTSCRVTARAAPSWCAPTTPSPTACA